MTGTMYTDTTFTASVFLAGELHTGRDERAWRVAVMDGVGTYGEGIGDGRRSEDEVRV